MIFLSCKANARVKLAKPGHGPHLFRIIVFCVVLVIVLCYVLIVCTVPLPPGVNPIAVDKYINMLLKNPVTSPGIDPGTLRLVAQRLGHYATPRPIAFVVKGKIHSRRGHEDPEGEWRYTSFFNLDTKWF